MNEFFDQEAFFNGQGLAKDYYDKKDLEREKEDREARKRKQQQAEKDARTIALGKPLPSTVRIRNFISESVISGLYKKQHGRCAICGKELHDHFHVDHDHKTNRVRGLLCLQCNVMLGMAHDNAKALSRSAKYLKTP